MTELAGPKLKRKRGDTAPDVMFITYDGDITGFEYVMTLNSQRNPTDDTTQLSQHVAVVIDDAEGLRAVFPWTDEQADQTPGKKWYDVQQKDPAGKLLTVWKNEYTFYQDIGKTT